ncbi:MAG: hypothetical protein EFKGCFLK_01481 [Rhodocyclaceae bacterium]|mgnify:CR=1 FL=1|nr:MAG: PaaI family thioesterase [Rhodocyclaceae bacterium]MBE7421852.1 PaaI family thioesterase [Zoogloeaceae bacterium]MBV6407913.1 hypothetical protein [Rhodocyclaceae bacterium]MCK6384391.1 PaaI family thioesterase [Rhodocyclaceae bacterium]CAG0932919.1 acyl-CoA thioesterase [Rhodocyclaceae bacterium]
MAKDRKFFGLDIPFIDLLQAQDGPPERGRATAAVEVRRELHNSWGYAHGGVVTTLLDVTMGQAARSSLPQGTGVVTVDLSVSFISAGRGRLTVEARVLRRGDSIVFCEGEVRDEAGELVAKAMASFKVKRKVSHGETAG